MNRFGAERDALEHRAANEMGRFGTARIDTALALLDISLPARAIAAAEEAAQDVIELAELQEEMARLDHEFDVVDFFANHKSLPITRNR
jgi:hypothetical protein